jgi:hypothetical protein
MLTPESAHGGSKRREQIGHTHESLKTIRSRSSDNSRYEALCLSSLSGFVVLDDVLGQTPAQNFRSSFGDPNTAHLAVPPLERQIAHQP